MPLLNALSQEENLLVARLAGGRERVVSVDGSTKEVVGERRERSKSAERMGSFMVAVELRSKVKGRAADGEKCLFRRDLPQDLVLRTLDEELLSLRQQSQEVLSAVTAPPGKLALPKLG